MSTGSKDIRSRVFSRCKGKCGYCGRALSVQNFHVDHVVPIIRGYTDEQIRRMNLQRGTDTYENMLPACPKCNLIKSAHSLEQFRQIMQSQIASLVRSEEFQTAVAFGLVKTPPTSIIFHFERLKIKVGKVADLKPKRTIAGVKTNKILAHQRARPKK